MAKKETVVTNEFSCPGCGEKLPLGTKRCKWCSTFISNPPTEPVTETPKKKSLFKKN